MVAPWCSFYRLNERVKTVVRREGANFSGIASFDRGKPKMKLDCSASLLSRGATVVSSDHTHQYESVDKKRFSASLCSASPTLAPALVVCSVRRRTNRRRAQTAGERWRCEIVPASVRAQSLPT